MCRIENFVTVDQNGIRERGSRIRPCERGTPSNPCNNRIIVEIGQAVPGPVVAPPPLRQLSPVVQIIEPRPRDRPRQPESTKRPRSFFDSLRLLFNPSNLFTSRKTKTSKPKPPKRELVVVRRRRGQQHHPEPEPARYHQSAPQPPLSSSAPRRRPSLAQVPIRRRSSEDMHARRRQGVPIRDLEHRDEQNSPPPITPNRQHRRPRARTLSPISRYEAQKRAQREAERRAWEVERERQEAERRRLHREREERERQHQAQRHAERERRRQRQRDAALQAAQMEAERERQRQQDQAQRAAEEQAAEARARRERLDRARIPRRPRHPLEVHQYTRGRGSLEDRGAQVLNDDIRAAEEAERNQRGWHWRPDFEGQRRRHADAVGERWVNDHDRRRAGRRHWF